MHTTVPGRLRDVCIEFMLLLEHDAKALLAEAGIPVPRGILVRGDESPPLESLVAPWIVKAQVPAGGRGKAGGVVKTISADEVREALRGLLGRTVKGHPVRSCRIEEAVTGRECYLALTLDPAAGQVRVLVSATGGVEIEDHATAGSVRSGNAAFDAGSVAARIELLAAGLGAAEEAALRSAAAPLARMFFDLEAVLLEINPLFVRADGSWVAGDVKLAIDDNALPRQHRLAELVRSRASDYPEAHLKLTQGFDFLVLDEHGEIGLVTTGAGLSMQLIDEIVARGHSPFDFCDIRTGQFRGAPDRLIAVLQWIAAGPRVRSVLMNFFAGVTQLGELAQVIVTALERVPALKTPVTVRMIGNGLDEAIAVFAASGVPVRIESDLEKALELALEPIGSHPS